MPYFCSGCPHNTSTVVPEGMRAYAGIGCHYMAQWMDRNTLGFTQMGGEGANWVGEAPFSKRNHVFQNIGDGTYNHSGYLAIRAAIASGVNVTYKILFNDAVAMTGGQANDGGLTVPQIAQQVAAEGAKRSSSSPTSRGNIRRARRGPPGSTIHHRDDLDTVQRSLAEIPGTTVLIYDQTCASEKRRRRKRGAYPDPDKRVIINELVCEGCGDCGVKSNCVSVQPLETEWGRKRTIDQSSCNKDFSCVRGFCPSFVTVEGAQPKKGTAPILIPFAPAKAGDQVPQRGPFRRLWVPAFVGRNGGRAPRAAAAEIDHTYDIIVTGVGGTGVVTIGAILGMAAHLEGKGVGIIDMAGLAQKGGAGLQLSAHRQRAGRHPRHPRRRRRGHLVLGGDIVVAGNKKVLAAVRHPARPRSSSIPASSCPATSPAMPTSRCRPSGSSARSRRRPARSTPASSMRRGLATALVGNAIGANHVHARLCLSARRAADLRRSDRAGDRAQRRGGGDEPGGLPLGPPRRARPASGRSAGEAPAGAHRRCPPAVDLVRGDGGAPGGLPHRLSGRRLCRTLPGTGRSRRRRRARQGAGGLRPRRGGRAQPVQADGLQGRIRSGATTDRRRLRDPGEERISTATNCGFVFTWRRPCSRASTRPLASRAR